jgi:AraC-like DNA-binding protein
VRIADPDSIARLAEQDVGAAARAAAASLPCDAADEDWPDMLASALRSCRPFSLGTWASQHRLAAATVTRGFRKAYGITPARYRAEIRARRAWQAVHASADPLAAIAGDGGFADQAHMTRAVRQVTGQPPGRWRTA